MNNGPCEYCGAALPFGVDKPTRRVRSHHFQNCSMRPQREAVEQPRREWQGLTVEFIREAIDDNGLDWHNGWTVGDDSVNRYLNLARAIEQALKERNT